MNCIPQVKIAAKVQGACFCGAVKIVPAHRSGQIRPPARPTCEHVPEPAPKLVVIPREVYHESTP